MTLITNIINAIFHSISNCMVNRCGAVDYIAYLQFIQFTWTLQFTCSEPFNLVFASFTKDFAVHKCYKCQKMLQVACVEFKLIKHWLSF